MSKIKQDIAIKNKINELTKNIIDTAITFCATIENLADTAISDAKSELIIEDITNAAISDAKSELIIEDITNAAISDAKSELVSADIKTLNDFFSAFEKDKTYESIKFKEYLISDNREESVVLRILKLISMYSDEIEIYNLNTFKTFIGHTLKDYCEYKSNRLLEELNVCDIKRANEILETISEDQEKKSDLTFLKMNFSEHALDFIKVATSCNVIKNVISECVDYQKIFAKTLRDNAQDRIKILENDKKISDNEDQYIKVVEEAQAIKIQNSDGKNFLNKQSYSKLLEKLKAKFNNDNDNELIYKNFIERLVNQECSYDEIYKYIRKNFDNITAKDECAISSHFIFSYIKYIQEKSFEKSSKPYVVLGCTGSGKSSFIQFLDNNLKPYLSKNGDWIVKEKIKTKEKFIIGHGIYPTTLAPASHDIANTTKSLKIWDMPGFGGNSSYEQEIISSYYISSLIQQFENIKFVPVFSRDSLRGKNEEFLKFIRAVKTLLEPSKPDIYVVTGVKSNGKESIKQKLKVIEEDVDDQYTKELISDLVKNYNDKVIIVPKPVNGKFIDESQLRQNSINTLSKVNNTKITDEDFRLHISDGAKNKIKDIVKLWDEALIVKLESFFREIITPIMHSIYEQNDWDLLKSFKNINAVDQLLEFIYSSSESIDCHKFYTKCKNENTKDAKSFFENTAKSLKDILEYRKILYKIGGLNYNDNILESHFKSIKFLHIENTKEYVKNIFNADLQDYEFDVLKNAGEKFKKVPTSDTIDKLRQDCEQWANYDSDNSLTKIEQKKGLIIEIFDNFDNKEYINDKYNKILEKIEKVVKNYRDFALDKIKQFEEIQKLEGENEKLEEERNRLEENSEKLEDIIKKQEENQRKLQEQLKETIEESDASQRENHELKKKIQLQLDKNINSSEGGFFKSVGAFFGGVVGGIAGAAYGFVEGAVEGFEAKFEKARDITSNISKNLVQIGFHAIGAGQAVKDLANFDVSNFSNELKDTSIKLMCLGYETKGITNIVSGSAGSRFLLIPNIIITGGKALYEFGDTISYLPPLSSNIFVKDVTSIMFFITKAGKSFKNIGSDIQKLNNEQLSFGGVDAFGQSLKDIGEILESTMILAPTIYGFQNLIKTIKTIKLSNRGKSFLQIISCNLDIASRIGHDSKNVGSGLVAYGKHMQGHIEKIKIGCITSFCQTLSDHSIKYGLYVECVGEALAHTSKLSIVVYNVEKIWELSITTKLDILSIVKSIGQLGTQVEEAGTALIEYGTEVYPDNIKNSSQEIQNDVVLNVIKDFLRDVISVPSIKYGLHIRYYGKLISNINEIFNVTNLSKQINLIVELFSKNNPSLDAICEILHKLDSLLSSITTHLEELGTAVFTLGKNMNSKSMEYNIGDRSKIQNILNKHKDIDETVPTMFDKLSINIMKYGLYIKCVGHKFAKLDFLSKIASAINNIIFIKENESDFKLGKIEGIINGKITEVEKNCYRINKIKESVQSNQISEAIKQTPDYKNLNHDIQKNLVIDELKVSLFDTLIDKMDSYFSSNFVHLIQEFCLPFADMRYATLSLPPDKYPSDDEDEQQSNFITPVPQQLERRDYYYYALKQEIEGSTKYLAIRCNEKQKQSNIKETKKTVQAIKNIIDNGCIVNDDDIDKFLKLHCYKNSSENKLTKDDFKDFGVVAGKTLEIQDIRFLFTLINESYVEHLYLCSSNEPTIGVGTMFSGNKDELINLIKEVYDKKYEKHAEDFLKECTQMKDELKCDKESSTQSRIKKCLNYLKEKKILESVSCSCEEAKKFFTSKLKYGYFDKQVKKFVNKFKDIDLKKNLSEKDLPMSEQLQLFDIMYQNGSIKVEEEETKILIDKYEDLLSSKFDDSNHNTLKGLTVLKDVAILNRYIEYDTRNLDRIALTDTEILELKSDIVGSYETYGNDFYFG